MTDVLSRQIVAPSRARRLDKRMLLGVTLLTAAAAARFGYDYWTGGRVLVSTDDAYVKADYMTVAPRVSDLATPSGTASR
jgi:membrane fusion protein, multidrug efflux system